MSSLKRDGGARAATQVPLYPWSTILLMAVLLAIFVAGAIFDSGWKRFAPAA